MRYAFVSTNLLDLWAQPEYNSERLSQLLLADLLTVGEETNGFSRVTELDGYTGWADRRFLKPISVKQFNAYAKNRNRIVTGASCRILSTGQRGTIAPHVCFYGTRLKCGHGGGSLGVGSLPDDSRFRIKKSAVRPILDGKGQDATGAQIVTEARKFLGIPYLWGGISPQGFDCSGLVRAVFGRFGRYLPRDTKDQILMGTMVTRQEVRTGDLLFFKRHVGIAIGSDQIIHASRGGNGVRVNSLTPERPDYRKDLDNDFNQARRLL